MLYERRTWRKTASSVRIIGDVMEESGLNDGLESIYASVTVWHMLTDKEFSITLKGNDFS